MSPAVTTPFTMVMLPPQSEISTAWARRLAADVPEATVLVPTGNSAAAQALRKADAAYGVLSPELLPHAERLRWLQAPMAGPPPGYYHAGLVAHPVVVTNLRGTYTDHVATHGLALLLALARGLPQYARRQAEHAWLRDDQDNAVLHLPTATVLIVGLGAVGAELARLLAPFRCTTIGTDARVDSPPEGVTRIYQADELDRLLPTADAVMVTVPHTPATERLFARRRLALMKPTAFLVNVGRGPVVDVDDVADALNSGVLRGAALDVFPEEPLAPEHPLWDAPGAIITPHVAGVGPHGDDRRYAVFVDNASRFALGRPLLNIVDKANWF
jgi:phosphoglycerate dehydrogenase-like enzyme